MSNQIQKPTEAGLASLYNAMRSANTADIEARIKSLGDKSNSKISDWTFAKKLADNLSEDEFISVSLGNLDEMPAIKLTNSEMELLKGGFWGTLLKLGEFLFTPHNCRTCDTMPSRFTPGGY